MLGYGNKSVRQILLYSFFFFLTSLFYGCISIALDIQGYKEITLLCPYLFSIHVYLRKNTEIHFNFTDDKTEVQKSFML